MHRRFLNNTASVVRVRESLRVLGSTKDVVRLDSGLKHGLDESIAVLSVSNASARNALSGKMMAEFADVMDQLETSEWLNKTKCLVIRGDHDWFCAGADLRVAKEQLSSTFGGNQMSTLMIHSLTRLRNLPYITLAAIEGAAIGGGAELITACDFRILNSDAYVRFVQSIMGLSPGWGGGTRLVQLVGRQEALKLLGTAQKCNATESLASGLVDRVSPSDEPILTTVSDFLYPYLRADRAVLQEIKKVVSNADDQSFDMAMKLEQQAFLQLWAGPSNVAALAKKK